MEILKKDIGNATINTIITFEYELKDQKELDKEKVNIDDLD